MSGVHSSYEDVVAARRGSAEFRAGYDEARRAHAIGVLVRERRLSLGLTQADLAARASMTQSALSRLEGGGALPTLAVLDRLAAAMGSELQVTFSAA